MTKAPFSSFLSHKHHPFSLRLPLSFQDRGVGRLLDSRHGACISESEPSSFNFMAQMMWGGGRGELEISWWAGTGESSPVTGIQSINIIIGR